LVTSTCPSSATTPAASGKPFSVARWRLNHLDAVSRGMRYKNAPGL
jgi:hypothetical protein